MHLAAGTTALNTCPLKFTSGPLNTSPESGAVEFLTDNLYLTLTSSSARKEITLNDSPLANTCVPFCTTNGRLMKNNGFTFDDTNTRLTVSRITLAAGAAAAGNGPLIFTSGTSLTTAVAGCVEFTTDDLFFTITTGTARKRLLMADATAGLTSGRVPFATTNGRLTDDGAFLFTAGTGITLTDLNMVLGTTTGTKFGTAASQKLSFWNATPIVQPTTAVAAATFAANTSGIANDTATFDGYTLGQVVKALRNAGLLA